MPSQQQAMKHVNTKSVGITISANNQKSFKLFVVVSIIGSAK
jgi:hypothetical protein